MAKKTGERFACDFRGLGNQKNEFSFGFNVSIKDMSLTKAYGLLAGAKLKIAFECDPNATGDSEGQATLGGDDENMIELVLDAESRRFAVNHGEIVATVKVHKDETDFNELDKFSYHKGYVRIERVGKVEAKAQGADGGEE